MYKLARYVSKYVLEIVRLGSQGVEHLDPEREQLQTLHAGQKKCACKCTTGTCRMGDEKKEKT